MRRVYLLALVALLAGCGGSNQAVAHVGDATITRDDLDATVDHFREEAKAEGRDFPKDGSPALETVEREALGLLVYHSELVQSAKKLGVPVTQAEIETRLASAGGESEESGAFARDTVRGQIAYEHVYTKVTSGVALARRAAAMQRWLNKMKRSYTVSYGAGLGPAP